MGHRYGHRIAAALVAALALGAQAAEICKWVDRDGTVHYSDVPLADRPCVERIRIQHADPLERVRAEERRAALLRQMQESQQGDARAQQAQAAQSGKAALRAARCTSARDELRFLKEAEGLRLLRAGREGEEPLVWLDDAQRAALIEAWRQQVQAWCESATDEPPEPPHPLAVPPPAR